MIRKIITIDDEKCDGCGLCIPGCPEGALQIIDGKARIVRDAYCDGLGACIGHCPNGAISIEEREAEEYDEMSVMESLSAKGADVVQAHLEHLEAHAEATYQHQARQYMQQKHATLPAFSSPVGCPGSQSLSFERSARFACEESAAKTSRLTSWPIQLHLINPLAPHLQGSDLLLSADCVAYAYADFHRNHLKDRSVAIACPKLDTAQERYVEKIIMMIDAAQVNSITVLVMQVPCCSGLLQLARTALRRSSRKVPLHYAIVSLQGEILQKGSEGGSEGNPAFPA